MATSLYKEPRRQALILGSTSCTAPSTRHTDMHMFNTDGYAVDTY